jgi:hypothetical protein
MMVLVALTVALLIGAAVSLQAQTPVPSAASLVLTLTPLPTGDGVDDEDRPGGTPKVSIIPIEYTQAVGGQLEPDSSAALYTFRGQEGDAVTISMTSWTFNSYLTLIDPYGSEIAWDDDGGGYPDALLGPYLLPQTGDYQIRASSYTSEPRGTFTLRLDKVEVANLALGESADITFAERDSAVYFAFDGKGGDVLNIVVNSDGTLDTRLRVRGASDTYDLIADDDSGAGFDPEISRLIIPYDNQYIITVEPYAPGMTGTVRLNIDASLLASLEDGTQTLSLGSKRSQDVVTFEGRAGEQVRITVVVTNGRPDYMTIHITQNGQEITSISSSFVSEHSFLITTPFDERVNVQLESSTNVVLEVTLERL